ncbi:MAG: uracil-DNA glycosylase [Thermogutta sp.]|nr:uracil-DNA glycosylase [Thermogutta sp.]
MAIQGVKRGLIQRLESLYAAGVRDWPRPTVVESLPFPENDGPNALREEPTATETLAVPSDLPADQPAVNRTGRPAERDVPSPAEMPKITADQEVSQMPRTREDLLKELAEQVAACRKCPVLVNYRTQTVFGAGNPYAELVFIGEAPGADEDRQGEPFVGRAGQLLTDMITRGMGMQRKDVYICNILRCRPPDNRTPTAEEASNCRPWLDATLSVIQPRYICCLGATAAKYLLQTEQPIGRLRGKVWEYGSAKVLCTYHPAYLLRSPNMKKEAWEDIKLLLRIMGRPIPGRSS